MSGPRQELVEEMLEVAKVHVVRHKVRVEGRSERSVARDLGISRNTVARYLRKGVEPGVRAPAPSRPKPVTERIEARVAELLETSRTTRKQRLTGPRIVEMLAAEGLAASPRTVDRIVAEWRRKRAEVFIPLEYEPGDLAEVDFFEVEVVVHGRARKAWMFVMRLMHSGRDFAWLYRWQDQSCFLDGHVRAFAHFGAVPKRILYDNLKAAVQKVLVGSERHLNERFVEMAAHYGFDARFARPRKGSDKGGVEARGKLIRWQHLSPVPEGPSLPAIAAALLTRLDASVDRPRRRGGETVRALWEQDHAAMLGLPERAHDPGILDFVGVDSQSQVRVYGARYSVPCAWKGLRVKAWRHADKIVVVNGVQRVERPRVEANEKYIDYRDYLPELARKPQAIEQVAQKLVAQLGAPFDAVWERLSRERGRKEAARAYKAVLAAILERGEGEVAGVLRRALDSDQDPVLALRPAPPPPAPVAVPPSLVAMQVPRSSLGLYDQLLGSVA